MDKQLGRAVSRVRSMVWLTAWLALECIGGLGMNHPVRASQADSPAADAVAE